MSDALKGKEAQSYIAQRKAIQKEHRKPVKPKKTPYFAVHWSLVTDLLDKYGIGYELRAPESAWKTGKGSYLPDIKLTGYPAFIQIYRDSHFNPKPQYREERISHDRHFLSQVMKKDQPNVWSFLFFPEALLISKPAEIMPVVSQFIRNVQNRSLTRVFYPASMYAYLTNPQ